MLCWPIAEESAFAAHLDQIFVFKLVGDDAIEWTRKYQAQMNFADDEAFRMR